MFGTNKTNSKQGKPYVIFLYLSLPSPQTAKRLLSSVHAMSLIAPANG